MDTVIKPQPLFTLTAEEVDIVQPLLTHRMEKLGKKSVANLSLDEMDEWFTLSTIIAKIKQWQDENRE